MLNAALPVLILAFGGIEKIWEVPLAQLLREPEKWTTKSRHVVGVVGFSPKGDRLAVTYHHPYDGGAIRHRAHLFVLDPESPASDLRQRDLEVCPEDLDWSPAGDQIGVCGAVFNLENGARCADGGTCFATRSGGRPPHPVPEGLLVRMDSPRDQADRYRKTILDSHTNHKIASWAVEDAGWRNSFEIIRRPAPSEIAPSGDLIAEATNQVIRLYRLKR